jgi:hypothetical protein
MFDLGAPSPVMAEPPPLPLPQTPQPRPTQPPALAPYPSSGPPEYPPEEADDEEDRPRRRRRRDEFDDDDIDLRLPRGRRRTRSRGDWTTASVGMKLIFGGMIAFTIAALIFQAATFGEPPQDAAAGQQAQRQNGVAGAGICLLLISSVIVFIGGCLCCTAPDRWAHRWALASVLVGVADIVLSCIGIGGLAFANANRNRGVVNQAELSSSPPFIVAVILLILIVVVAFVLAMLFHAAVARALGNAALLHQSYWFIAAPFVQFGIAVFMHTIVSIQRNRGNEPSEFAYAMFSVLLMVTSMVTYGGYAAISWQTFRTMDAAGQKRSE